MKSAERVTGVLTGGAALLRVDERRKQIVLGISPWRLEQGPTRWDEAQVVCRPVPSAEADPCVSRYRIGRVVRFQAFIEEVGSGSFHQITAIPQGDIEVLSDDPHSVGFAAEAPPLTTLPSLLAGAEFTPGYDTLIALVKFGVVEAETLLLLDGSTEKAVVRKKVAKYVTRLEDVIARWTAIEQEVRGRAASIPPEGPKPSDWKLASVMLDGRRTTLMFEDAANEDAEHGLEAKLDTKGKLVSVDRP